MSKTLLAVDDSATIRKALEITFGGEGYRVLAADNRAAALARLADKPDLILIDTVLGADDGYALCKEVRAQAPGAAIVLLSSRFNPYDTGRGQAAGADEYCDKPFDTQQLLDKARTVLEAKASQPTPAPAAPAAAATGTPGAPYRAPAAEAPTMGRGPTPTPANAIPAVQREEPRPPSQPAGRAQTLVFGSSPVNAQTANPYATGGAATPPSAPPAQAQKPAGPPPVPVRQPAEPPRPAAPAASAPPPMPPRPAPTAAPAAPVAPTAPPVEAAVAAQLAPKLGALGLSKEQADAVLALSREVVERVVWEVVPQLAEVLIREEIQRLTKD